MMKLSYETPEIEMISFETNHMIMNGIQDNGADGKVFENPFAVSGSGDVLNGKFSDLKW